MQLFLALCVIADGTIPSLELHVSGLAFAEVVEDPFAVPPVGIAELKAVGAGDDENNRMVHGGNDPALSCPLYSS
jgi:hypothetical protein